MPCIHLSSNSNNSFLWTAGRRHQDCNLIYLNYIHVNISTESLHSSALHTVDLSVWLRQIYSPCSSLHYMVEMYSDFPGTVFEIHHLQYLAKSCWSLGLSFNNLSNFSAVLVRVHDDHLGLIPSYALPCLIHNIWPQTFLRPYCSALAYWCHRIYQTQVWVQK